MFKKFLVLVFILPVLCCATDKFNKGAGKTALDTLRIHPIGDSITRGKDGNTYRQYLRKQIINEMGIEVDFVGS